MGIVVNEGTPVSSLLPSYLDCNYASLVNEVAFHIFNMRPTSSDVITDGVAGASQAETILRVIGKGLRFVYSAHRWSFLRPLVTITTVEGTYAYTLPAGVDSLEGRLTYPQGTSQPREYLDRTTEVEIRRMLARDSTQGRPCLYAEAIATFSALTGSTRSIALYPIPDDEYVLTAIGTLRPKMIDSVNQYPLGGELLAPCLTESCLAAAERDVQHMDAGSDKAVHNRALGPLLAMAIQRDKEYAAPETLGVDHGSDSEEHRPPRRTGSIYWNAGGGYTGYL